MSKRNTYPSRFDAVDAVVDKCVKGISALGAVSLVVIAVISTVNVFFTKVLSRPISNVTELVTYLNIPTVFFCIGYVQLERGHTHIDLIYQHLPKPVHTAVHILGYLIGVAVCGFAGWRGIVLTIQKAQSMTYASGPTSFLIWPFVACIGIGYLVLAFSFLWCIPRELRGRGPYETESGGDPPAKGA